MASQFTINDSISIDARPEKVWDVLTLPDYIRQWDDIPEDYPGGSIWAVSSSGKVILK